MSVTDVDALLQEGKAALRSRRLDEALGLFQQVLALAPDHPETRESLASTLFLKGDYAGAVQAFALLAEQHPQQTRYCVNLGAAYNRLGEHKKAEESLRRALQRDHRSSDAYYNLGITYRKLNQTNLAISAYREAVRLNPQMSEAYYNLGNVYAELENHTLAVMSFQKAVEIRPDFEKARAALVRSEQTLDAARQALSPFGKLTPAASVVCPVNCNRQLSEEERATDRERLLQLAEQVKHLTEQSVNFLRDTLEPRLHGVQKVVAGGGGRNQALIRAGQELREAVEEWAKLRRQLRRKVLEVRAHEELMATPEVAI